MIADDVLDGLAGGVEQTAGVLLRPLVEALLEPVTVTSEAMTLTPEGWAVAFDLDGTHPQWIAQLVGVTADPTLSPESQREVIRSRAAWATGTYRALVASLRSALRGEKRVVIDERDAGAWHTTISVYESDYAAGTTQDTIRALAELHRPAGVAFDFVFFPPHAYAEAELTAGTYAEAELTAGTYRDAEE